MPPSLYTGDGPVRRTADGYLLPVTPAIADGRADTDRHGSVMKSNLLSFALLLAAVPLSSAAGDADRLAAIVANAADGAAPGCALATFREGALDVITASGYADIENHIPLDADTPFYAASVSKQFTALAVMQLVVQGRISLDDDARTHLPDLPVYSAPVTVRMLLQHTSGIRDSLSLLKLAGYEHASSATMDQATDLLLAQTETNFVPGTSVTYSNGAYLILARIVERITGERFSSHVRQAILEPLGMQSSFVLDGDVSAPDTLAHGYVRTGRTFERRDTYPRFGGSGGLVLTLRDLARYEHDIEVGRRIWTPEILALMTEPGTLTDGSPATRETSGPVFAAGLVVGKRQGHDVVQHGGGAEGFRHVYARLPAQHLGIAVFCNHGDADPQGKLDATIAALVEPAPGYTSPPPLSGIYRSDELRTQYLLEHVGDTVTIEIRGDDAIRAPQRMSLRRTHAGTYDGVGDAKGVTLRADGHDLLIGTAGARDLRFRRTR